MKSGLYAWAGASATASAAAWANRLDEPMTNESKVYFALKPPLSGRFGTRPARIFGGGSGGGGGEWVGGADDERVEGVLRVEAAALGAVRHPAGEDLRRRQRRVVG